MRSRRDHDTVPTRQTFLVYVYMYYYLYSKKKLNIWYTKDSNIQYDMVVLPNPNLGSYNQAFFQSQLYAINIKLSEVIQYLGCLKLFVKDSKHSTVYVINQLVHNGLYCCVAAIKACLKLLQ